MLTAAVRTLRGGALARLGSAGAGASGWMSRLGCSGVALQGQIHTHTLRATAVEASMRPAWGRGFTASAARLGAEDFFTPFFDRKATPENEKDMLVGVCLSAPVQSNSNRANLTSNPDRHASIQSTAGQLHLPQALGVGDAGDNALSTKPPTPSAAEATVRGLCCRESVGVQAA